MRESSEPSLEASPQPSNAGECLFCRIVDGRVPASVVAEHPLALAFRDINPTAPTHALVIPRRHIPHAGAITADDADVVAAMFLVAQQVAAADGIDGRGYRLVFNVGEDSGNSVDHLHLHVVGGRRLGWPPFAT